MRSASRCQPRCFCERTRSSNRPWLLHLLRSPIGRFCCKSPFGLAIKNFQGFRRDFLVKMWGTSSPNDKLAGDLGTAIEGTRIGGRRSVLLPAGNLAPGNRGLLQQYRHSAGLNAAICSVTLLKALFLVSTPQP